MGKEKRRLRSDSPKEYSWRPRSQRDSTPADDLLEDFDGGDVGYESEGFAYEADYGDSMMSPI